MSTVDELASGDRHRGREVALQVLYAIDLGVKPEPLLDPANSGISVGESVGRPAGVSPGVSAEITTEASAEAGATHGASVDGATEPLRALVLSELDSGVFDRIAEHFDVPKSAVDFARELVAGVTARCADLDELLGLHARNWRVSRMAVVDRNVLRLAAYELRDTETPVAVVIDEAVDLARRFGADTSPSFVNGVLDAIARELRAA